MREPDSRTMASYLSAHSSHVIIFHLITEGRGDARIEHDGRQTPWRPETSSCFQEKNGDMLNFPAGGWPQAYCLHVTLSLRRLTQ